MAKRSASAVRSERRLRRQSPIDSFKGCRARKAPIAPTERNSPASDGGQQQPEYYRLKQKAPPAMFHGQGNGPDANPPRSFEMASGYQFTSENALVKCDSLKS